MITAKFSALDFSGRLILRSNEALSNVVRETFLTFPTGRLERISEFLSGALPSSPEVCCFFFSFVEYRPSLSTETRWGNKISIYLWSFRLCRNSGQIIAASFCFQNKVFEISQVQQLLFWKFKQITKIRSSFCFLLLKVFDDHLMVGGHHSQKPFTSCCCILCKKEAEFKTCPRIHAYFLPPFERLRGVKSCT